MEAEKNRLLALVSSISQKKKEVEEPEREEEDVPNFGTSKEEDVLNSGTQEEKKCTEFRYRRNLHSNFWQETGTT